MGKMSNVLNKQLMQNSLKGTQTVKGSANGEVKTYFISPEELEKYRAIPAPSEDKVKKSNSKVW